MTRQVHCTVSSPQIDNTAQTWYTYKVNIIICVYCADAVLSPSDPSYLCIYVQYRVTYRVQSQTLSPLSDEQAITTPLPKGERVPDNNRE